MRKSRTHSARALGKKSAGKRGGRKRDARVPMIVLCALGTGILAAAYGLTHQGTPAASVNAQAPGIAAPKNDKSITSTASTAINGQAARKEDRLVTGSMPKQEEIAPSKIDNKTKRQVAKKKPATAVAKAETPKSFFDVFGPDTQQKR
jgi:hypothetical protein